jgi:Phage gp6-like head-tail connector protein
VPYDNLCTLQQLKSWLSVTTGNDDPNLSLLIEVASEAIGRYCGRDNLGAVYSYTENYFKRGAYRLDSHESFDLVLRHWPVVSLTSVVMNGASQTILNETTLQSYSAGIYLLEDPTDQRILKFRYLYRTDPITISYTAGYAAGTIPAPLAQACLQYAAEIFKSAGWVMKKSVTVGGETVAMDEGTIVGMSSRVTAALQPYRNVVPFLGAS